MADTPKDANERYFQAAVAHQTGVQRMAAGESRRMRRIMDKWDRELADLLRRRVPRLLERRGFDIRGPVWRQLMRDIRKNRKAAIAEVKSEFREVVSEFGTEESNFEISILAAALAPFTPGLSSPDASAIRSSIFSSPFAGPSGGGRTLNQWFQLVERSSTASVIDLVQRGIQEKSKLNSILAQVIGTRSQGFSNGAIAATRRGINTTVRTAITHISSVVREHVWNRNISLIAYLKWKAILDGHTTQICRKRSNRNAPIGGIGTVPPPKLVPSNARPPAHPNCRSMMIPVLRGGGPVPDLDYTTWLRKQPASFQDDLLGKAKGALFRRGGLDINQFSDGAGGELTLGDLARTQPQAFAKANLDTEDFL